MKKEVLLIMLFLFFGGYSTKACTSAIISGKVTLDGKPLMWKHFDNEKQLNKKVIFLTEGKYSAMAVVNAGYKNNVNIWMGYNSAGFAIMSTDSGNLQDSIQIKNNQSGIFMKMALLSCASIEEFELFLKKYETPHNFRANIGVIDAFNRGVYYEIDNFNYMRYDVDDTSDGYLIRTNYSMSGTPRKGHGYTRYNTANKLINRKLSTGKMDIHYLLDSVCLSLEDTITNQEFMRNRYLKRYEVKANRNIQDYLFFDKCINRYSTGASAVIQGVIKGELPSHTTMWTMVGFPLTSIAIPVWITPNGILPSIITGENDQKAMLCNFSLQLKEKLIYDNNEEGKHYINISLLTNTAQTGITQILAPIRRRVLKKGIKISKLQREDSQNREIKSYYEWIDSYILQKYKSLVSTKIKDLN